MPRLEEIKMTKATNQAFRSVISGYINALYKQQLPQKINILLEKYEPTAKKLREEEEKATKKALEESKKPRKVIPIRTAGTPPMEEDFDYAAGYTPYDYYAAPTYYPTTPSYAPMVPTTAESRPTVGPKAGPAKPGEAKPGEEKEKDKDKAKVEDKDKEKDKDKAKAPTTPKPAPKQPTIPAQEEKAIKKMINSISGDLKDATRLMEKNESLMNLQKHLSDEKVPVDKKLVDRLPVILDNMQSALNGVKSLQKKLQPYPLAIKNQYKKELATQLEDYQDTLKTVVDQAQTVKNTWTEIQAKISSEKRAAYFGESLTPLEENIQEYLAAYILGAKDEAKKYYDAALAEYSAPSFKTALNDLQKAIDRKDARIDRYKNAVEHEVEQYKAAQVEKKKKAKPEELKEEIKKPTIFDIPKAIDELQKAIKEL
jgi:hypothetical protein